MKGIAVSHKGFFSFSKNYLLLAILTLFLFPMHNHAQYPIQKGTSGIDVEQMVGTCSNMDSDYYIYLGWSNIVNPCPIFKKTNLVIEWINLFSNETRHLYTIGSPSKSYNWTGKEYKDAVGPGVEAVYKFQANFSGTFCSGYSRTGQWGYTSALRPPGEVTATDGAFDDKVVVTWLESSTDVPDDMYTYLLYRDGEYIESFAYNELEYEDYNVLPGKVYSYAVETAYAAFRSERKKNDGNAHDLNVTTDYNEEDGGLNIGWEWPSTVTATPDGFDIYRIGESGKNIPVIQMGATARGYIDAFVPVPGYKYQYFVTPYKKVGDDILYFKSDTAIGGVPPNGIIEGNIHTPIDPKTGRSAPVVDVLVCAKRISGEIPQGEDTLYCAHTNAQGYYKIEDIYYYTGATFEIRPFKENHVFLEEVEVRDLDTDNPQPLEPIDFIDESSFSVSGRVYQVFNGDTCGLIDVDILVDSLSMGWTTDSAGYYSLTVDLMAEYNIKPSFSEHGFWPGLVDTLVAENIWGLDFEDTTRHILSGSVTGPCNSSIGVAELLISSIGDKGCFETTVLSDADGFYEIELPARSYTVDVIGLAPHDDEKINYFEMDTVDLTQRDTMKNFVFRPPPLIQISNLPARGGGDFQVPIWKQHTFSMLKIEVLDNYGEHTCPVQEGYVIIKDEVSDGRTEPVGLLLDSAGAAYYPMMAGIPNITAMPGNHPYQKRLHIKAYAGQESNSHEQYVLVTGHRPRTPEFFNTSPDLVHWVLRDPPGDMSYSYLEKDSSISTFISQETVISDGAGVHVDLQLGVIVSVGAGVTTDVGAYVYGHYDGFWVDESDVVEGKQVSLTTEEEFKTSDGDRVLGEDGDVYIGATYTLAYGLTDVIDFDWTTNKVVKDTNIAWDIDSLESTFMYTESHIRKEIIPELIFLRDHSDPVKAARFQEDIDNWKYELFFNDSLKNEAMASELGNIDFSGGVGYNYTSQIEERDVNSKKIKHTFDSEWSAGAGGVVSGCVLNVGYKGSYSKSISNDTLEEASGSMSTGFHLEDDDPEDEFSVTVRDDLYYGTPVFELFSGTSSCPWEKGTQPHEGVAMSLDTYEQTVAADKMAHFKLFLANTSESGASRDYRLSLVHSSNPEGAIIEVGSGVMGDDELRFNEMAPNSDNPLQQTVRVHRVEGSSFVYNDLQLQFYSACDPQILARVAFDVQFENACSHVRLDKPMNNWIIGTQDEGSLDVVLKDYMLSDNKISRLGFQYRQKGAMSWLDVFSLEDDFVGPDSVHYTWDVSAFADGQYEVRASVLCDEGFYFTKAINGIIDRSVFVLEGAPSPANGLYKAGDEISLSFNANIDPVTVNPECVRILRLRDDSQLDLDISCKENKLTLTPVEGTALEEGERLRALVSDIGDQEGHCMQFPVSWEFKVQESITDIRKHEASAEFYLGQNHPNPFGEETSISYGIEKEGHVRLSVFDLNGRELMRLVDYLQPPGEYTIPVKAKNLESGVYIYRIQTGTNSQSRKMILEGGR